MDNRSFYKNFAMIALPMAFQNIVTTSVNLIDNLMIGQLGDVSIAAVGLANKVYFIYTLIVFGLCSGACAFISQYWGKEDFKGIKKTVFIDFIIGILVSLIFALFAFFMPEGIMKLLTDDPQVILEGAKYLKIIGISYLFSGVIFVFAYTLKALEHPKIPLFASLISVGINAFLNYVLIFGNFGAPALGVTGAAIATLIARIFECIFTAFCTVNKLKFLFEKFNEYKDITKEFTTDFLKKVTPVIANEAMWALATTIMVAVYARISTKAVAAVNVVTILRDLTSVFFVGAGNAAGVLIGKLIGNKKYDEAYDKTIKLSLIVPLMATVIGVLTLFISPAFISMFNVTEETKSIAVSLYIVAIIFMPFSSFNHLNICGTLRSGGDSLYCLITDAGSIWGLGVIGSFIGGIILGLPILPVYIISRAEEVLKTIILSIRIIKKNWIKDLVN